MLFKNTSIQQPLSAFYSTQTHSAEKNTSNEICACFLPTRQIVTALTLEIIVNLEII